MTFQPPKFLQLIISPFIFIDMAECAIVVENEYWYYIPMKICLSHCGWMVTRHLVNTNQLRLGILPRNDLLLDLSTGWHVPNRNSSLKNAMLTGVF